MQSVCPPLDPDGTLRSIDCRDMVADRAARVRFHQAGCLLGVQGAGKVLEVFLVRDEAQSKKKMKR